jgi:succinate dehydrogenase / fumarate reductase, iron-sulfur subunit
MNLTLRIWRQQSANTPGGFHTYHVKDVTRDMSFLEMLDALNEDLLSQNAPPVAFEHDCREGICGSCGFLINGVAHGGQRGTTVCQLSMRFFKDDDSLTLEPWRARAFPVIRDLIVNRSAFDRIIQAGGFISAPTGSAPDANAILVRKEAADTAFDAATCIGCGACVAACPNAAAMLFTSAKITECFGFHSDHDSRPLAAPEIAALQLWLSPVRCACKQCSIRLPPGLTFEQLSLMSAAHSFATALACCIAAWHF